MSDSEIATLFAQWRARTADEDELSARLIAQCESPGGIKRLTASAAVAEYRCAAKRCLLLLVCRTPRGLMFYQPPYRFAPAYNKTHSSRAGRTNNTVDGDRRWKPQAGVLDERYRDAIGGLEVNCGHVGTRLVTGDELLGRAGAATPGKPYRQFV